ncbi:glutaminase A [Pseudonocardia sp.]|uniref:glutaminase A n=1 Tax=Pseudonocardia sp. TaxID=60912 RepID=UPI003D0E8F60
MSPDVGDRRPGSVRGTAPGPDDRDAPRHVSTGTLPDPDRVGRLLADAHARFGTLDDGTVSTVYPALATARPELFGLAVAAVTGRVLTVGDAGVPFTMMSVAKPFVFALACAAVGVEQARRRTGVNATGLPFDSFAAIERSPDGRTNPMVNAGALVTCALLPGRSLEQRWEHLRAGLSRFAGRELALDADVHRCVARTNHRNRGLARLLRAVGTVTEDPDELVELYTRQSCLAVTATDLALMGATLADAGVQPATGERVVDPGVCRAVLVVMTTAGLYETSGDWLYDIGLPGKSGIGGGIVAVAPGKGALGTFSPPLDTAGNSVRGQRAAAYLSRALGLDLFASAPAPVVAP